MIWNLVMIAVIIMLVFESGFVDSIDLAINRRWRFFHLPKPFSCSLCMTFWTTLIYIMINGELTFFNVMICLLLAHSEEFLAGLLHTLKGYLEKLLDVIDIK